MYYLAKLKDGANASQFKAALSRNGMKYREDKNFPKFMAIRSSRSHQELMEKFNKYSNNIAPTHAKSLIEAIEMLYTSHQNPAVIRCEPEPIKQTEATKIIYNAAPETVREPDAPTLTSQPGPVKKKRFDFILSLVYSLIGRRTR